GGQAHGSRRCVLARRFVEAAAHANLRNGVLLEGGSPLLPRARRGGEAARPPPARSAARPLPLLRALARLSALAPEGNGALPGAREPPSPRERQARLSRGADADHLRRADVRHLGPLPEVRGPDVQ